VPRLDGGNQRLIVDEPAPCEVRDIRAWAEPRQLPPSDHAHRLVVERSVHRDDVGGVQQLVERRGTPNAQRRETILRHVRVIPDDVHAERARAGRDLAADPTDTDDAERSVLQLAPEQLRAVPPALTHRRRRMRQVAEETDERTEEQLGDCDRVAGRRVDDRDAQGRRRIERNVVDPDACSPDDAKSRSAPQ
jgi:hypothetical protein